MHWRPVTSAVTECFGICRPTCFYGLVYRTQPLRSTLVHYYTLRYRGPAAVGRLLAIQATSRRSGMAANEEVT